MTGIRRLLSVFTALALTGALSAQTYVGNLNGSSTSSTFEVSGSNSLPTLGWEEVSGSIAVRQFTNEFGNGVIIAESSQFGDYAVQYNTGTTLQINSNYTLSFLVGFVSGGSTGTAEYTVTFGTSADSGLNIAPLSVNTGAASATIDRGAGGNIQLSLGASAAHSQQVTLTFLTGGSVSSDPLYVRWAQTNSTGTVNGEDFFGFDNVTLSVAAIPEPSTYAALLGLGALGLAARRRLRHLLRPSQPGGAGRLLGGLALAGCLGLLPGSVQSQTILLNENFENPTGAGIPAGWSIDAGSYDDTTANPNASGINTSGNVLIADLLSSRVGTPVMDISGLIGQTFTLEFDLYNPTETTSHGIIIGYGESGVVNAWAASSSGGTGPLGGGQILINLSAPATWQHFSIDITSWINAYDSGPDDPSLFTLSFQDWATPTSVISSLDNVVLTAIPEPSTCAALLGLGALGLGAWRRRRAA